MLMLYYFTSKGLKTVILFEMWGRSMVTMKIAHRLCVMNSLTFTFYMADRQIDSIDPIHQSAIMAMVKGFSRLITLKNTQIT